MELSSAGSTFLDTEIGYYIRYWEESMLVLRIEGLEGLLVPVNNDGKVVPGVVLEFHLENNVEVTVKDLEILCLARG